MQDVTQPVLFGRYELLGVIGHGGMATVYLAQTAGAAGVRKRVALKRLRRSLAQSPRFLEMFISEARVAVSLTHAQIVPIFDFGRVGDEYFLAMEYVDGRDFGAILARAQAAGEKIAPHIVAFVGAEVCRALDYAHRRGMVHRDVTPRNILCSLEGEIRLADFGVARAMAEATADGVQGTLAYMAPEQARGEPTDARADLYALGSVLYEAVAGCRARASSDAAVLLGLARSGQAAPPPIGDPDLCAIVAHAMAANLAERFGDAQAMEQDLRRVAASAGQRDMSQLLARMFAGEQSPSVEPLTGDAVVALTVNTAEHESTYLGGMLTAPDGRGSAEVTTERPRAVGTQSGPVRPTRIPQRSRSGRLVSVAIALVAVGALTTVFWVARPTTAPQPSLATVALVAPTAVPSPAATPRVPEPEPDPEPDPDPEPEPATRHGATHARRNDPKPVAISQATGTLDLGAVPWAHVIIDGKPVGNTPLVGFSLPVGTHRIRLENPPLGADREIIVEIQGGKKTTQVVRLD